PQARGACRDARVAGGAALPQPGRAARRLELTGAPAEDALVADAPRDAVRVETLEQELRGLAAGAEQVAEARERDAAGGLAFLDERLPGPCVGVGRDRVAVADADEPPALLEEARERGIVDPHRLEAELRLERGRRLGTRAELGRRARAVELGAAAFEAEQRHHRGPPGLRRRRDAGVERVGGREPRIEVGAQLVEPGAGEDPAVGALDARQRAEMG